MTSPNPMHCRQAKTELALWVGGDLDEASVRQVERHVALCPECRSVRDSLQASQSALQSLAECDPAPAARSAPPPRPISESLWPSLSVRLAERDARRDHRFNGWLPALAVTAASIAVIFVAGQNAAQFARNGGGLQPMERLQTPIQPMPVFAPSSEFRSPSLDPVGPSLDDRNEEFGPWLPRTERQSPFADFRGSNGSPRRFPR